MVRRVYVEKKQGFDMEARRLKEELAGFLGEKYPELARLRGLRVLKRYDVSNLSEGQFGQLAETVFSEPQCDRVFFGAAPEANENERCFGIEYLPGQYDQRADSAEQCAELVAGVRPKIRTASFYVFEGEAGPLSGAALDGVKKYLINPVDSREASVEVPLSLDDDGANPPDVPALTGFAHNASPEKIAAQYGLSMSIEDLRFCREWFAGEGRDPTLSELRVLDTYWSDHCRHTTFNTFLEEIKIAGMNDGVINDGIKNALELYEEARREVYGDAAETRPRSLMDMATIGAKALKKRGLTPDVDESSEINACTVKITAGFPDGLEPWLLLFNNVTHNPPTEIEPFGGAATCLGGAIRDPLSGRAFIHQAMRVTGGGDPGAGLNETLPGKLPQIKIACEAAAGYASYGNQIGLATGQVAEFYHPGFLAKRMELGAVIAAVPEAWVRREEPLPGDVVILVGGRTGRDGIGGATGSSKVHSGESVESSGAEVQKGNAVEERKLQRLFRKAEVSRLIKRCNDFGAGGVSVAVGELAAGLDIDLDAVPKKYAGLDGTELAISESQERMAVVVSASDTGAFIKAAAAENLEAVVIAKVTAGLADEDKARLRMTWRGKTIVDLSREFLNSNGAPRRAKVLMSVPDAVFGNSRVEDPLGALERELAGLRSGSRRGLQERFDGSVGASSVLFPWGGGEQGTPECGMVALLPSLGKQSRTASLMTFGYDPVLMSVDPYRGAKGAVREALAKFACLGGDPFTARLSLQEYFEKPLKAETWGRPAAALLGALEAQLRLGVPAIGGKDSMSGNYNAGETNLAVPPTLVAFAAGTAPAASVRSGALSGKAGNAVVLLAQPPENLGFGNTNACIGDEWEAFKTNMKTLRALAASGALKAAYPVGPGGVAATLAVMAFGNMTGVEAYADAFSFRKADHVNYQGSVLAEIDEAALPAGLDASWTLAARTLSEPVFRILPKADDAICSVGDANRYQLPLSALRRAYESPLAKVYPQTSTGATVAEPPESAELVLPAIKASFETRKYTRLSTQGAPMAVLPVFPGTNCEWDMERAFREVGARTRLVIFRNRNGDDIAESLRELVVAFAEAQIIAFSGGFSAGDEPDGSGKFIANVIRCGPVTVAITEFLERRDGLMLGICNGFQALIKTGLVPYGRIIPPANSMPTLTYNAIGRHVSRMVRTRVMPNVSPWLGLEEPGAIHLVPVSHGEGRLVITDAEAEALFGAGQVPFCYADSGGSPTMAEPDNPNGSAFAIEALTSPDGRVLGKMAHSERRGEFVHVNIPGNKRQTIFEAGVGYFR
ncbi:MAG: phosphoribosylformylglycinamidine synthase, partial [Treponema sp.]|jgi:phosphoribosylformylglycinamidine synthase|nr:phosphoribosylformylglycinamidine synthase [Treponema sp.]